MLSQVLEAKKHRTAIPRSEGCNWHPVHRQTDRQTDRVCESVSCILWYPEEDRQQQLGL